MERTLTFDIPDVDYDMPQQYSMNGKNSEFDQKVCSQMQASCQGQLFSVQYSLKVFVRHDSKQQFGEGVCVTLPIKMLERPVPYVQTQFESLDTFIMSKVPTQPTSGWKVCTNARAQKFYETYVKEYEMQWTKGAAAVVMTEDQMKVEEKEMSTPVENTVVVQEVVVEEKLEEAQPMGIETVVAVEDDKNQKSVAEEVKEVRNYDNLHPCELAYRMLEDDPIHGVKITSDFESAKTEWNFELCGPDESLYKNGLFKVKIHTVGFPERPPMCQFKTKIWHPQVREDGFGRFWVEVAPGWTVRNLIETIREQLIDVNQNTMLHIQKTIAAEYETDRVSFDSNARDWTDAYAKDLSKFE